MAHQRTVVVTCGEGFEWVESLQRCDVACPPGVARDGFGNCVYIAPYAVNQVFRPIGLENEFAQPIAPLPPAPRVVRWIEPRNMPTPRPMPSQRLWPGTPAPYVLGQSVSDPFSIGQAKAALFAWSKSPGVVSPLSNYGTSLEDVNPNWTQRDGIMLHAFSVWWNADHPQQQIPLGIGNIASAALTVQHMAALKTFGAAQIPPGFQPPPIPTTLPTPAQGQAQAACALACEQKHGITSGALNPTALAACLQACAQGQSVTPQPTLPPPANQPTLPPAQSTTDKKSNTGLLVVGGLAAAVIVGVVAMGAKKGLASNPRGTTVDSDAARELDIYIDNDSRFSPMGDGIGRAVLNNLKKKMAKGTYNHALAPKAWMYVVDSAARAYVREIGGVRGQPTHEVFNAATRRKVASDMADYARDMIKRGEW